MHFIEDKKKKNDAQKVIANFPTSHSLWKSLSRVWLFATPWTVACQAPLSMEFSRQEYWSELPFPSPFQTLVCIQIKWLAYLLALCQSCPTLRDPMGCSPPGSSVLGILPARILEWVAISNSRESSQPRDWAHVSWVSCIGRWALYHWPTDSAVWGLKHCLMAQW